MLQNYVLMFYGDYCEILYRILMVLYFFLKNGSIYEQCLLI